MAYSNDKKPGELTALTTLASDDVFVVGDTSDASEVAKGITKANVQTDLVTTAAVTEAGALMDSEVTDLAGVKALDTSTLQVKPSEGAFVDGDKTKLDGIEALADVTDTANVTAAGALMDSEVDADIKTLSLPANTTISAFGATLVDDADAATARTTLDVDQAGTDNSTDVTLAGTGTYLSLTGQQITVDPITESDIADLGTYLENVVEDTTPQLGGDLDAQDKNVTGAGRISFTQELDNGSKSANFSIDFATDQKQKVTLTANTMTLTFDTTSIGVGTYLLKIVNGGLATLTWAAETGAVYWPGGTDPTLTSSGTDIVSVYFDGTNFYCVASLAFS